MDQELLLKLKERHRTTRRPVDFAKQFYYSAGKRVVEKHRRQARSPLERKIPGKHRVGGGGQRARTGGRTNVRDRGQPEP